VKRFKLGNIRDIWTQDCYTDPKNSILEAEGVKGIFLKIKHLLSEMSSSIDFVVG
jgi:hypothetical protein